MAKMTQSVKLNVPKNSQIFKNLEKLKNLDKITVIKFTS